VRTRWLLLLAATAVVSCAAARATAPDPEQATAADTTPAAATVERPWKLTLGDYIYSNYSGGDVNLRWRRNDTDAWVGVYSDRLFGTQGRVGADTSINLTDSLQLQPSLQLATQGFVGGSLTLQVGGDWFGIAGIGRTNLKPYFNLNFDPNDALTFGVGHRTAGADHLAGCRHFNSLGGISRGTVSS